MIAAPMGYKYAVLFPRARDALTALERVYPMEFYFPSNICREAFDSVKDRYTVAVNPETGLAPRYGVVTVQLYGFRVADDDMHLDLDPLMTGWYARPHSTSAIISFGRNKILPLNGGGAFLTQDEALKEQMKKHAYFPGGVEYAWRVCDAIRHMDETVNKRFERIALWDRHLGDSLIRIPGEQIMPWRVMRRVTHHTVINMRDVVVRELRAAGIAVGTNYPPLPGVTDPGALQWGAEVINFLIDAEETYDSGQYVF